MVSSFQRSPGYMDADYYFLGGWRLAEGRGFSEPVLWNYLDDPGELPHPSHAYWMPLTSVLAAGGIQLGGGEAVRPLDAFPAARIPFLILAAAVAPLTAWMAHDLGSDRRGSFLAGLLAIFAGFYLPFLVTTDTFGLYMLLGALFIQISYRLCNSQPIHSRGGPFAPLAPALLGLMAGLMHLARADGALWLLVGLAAIVLCRYPVNAPEKKPVKTTVARLAPSILLAMGYLLVMGPWMARNLAEFGTPLAPGGARALWLTGYDELFAYPPNLLTAERWWSAGMRTLFSARLQALGTNLLSAFAVQGQIFLAPLVLVGVWVRRRDPRVRLGALAWLATLASMTVLFPYPGMRGGFFHSGAAVQPLIWALTPAGLEAFARLGSRLRGWDSERATRVFGPGLVLLAALLSILLVRQRVLGWGEAGLDWNQGARAYEEIADAVSSYGPEPDEPVLINNPPGFYLVSSHPAIVIPDGGPEAVLAAADRFGARLLILEENHPRGLAGLFSRPRDHGRLRYLGPAADGKIYWVAPPAAGPAGGGP